VVGPPIGLLSIGSTLKREGFEVTIIDAAVESGYRNLVEKEISRKPLFVGLSVMTPQVPAALEISDLIKSKSADIPLVWGGIHPTLYPEQTLKDRSADIIVRGIGEEAVVELSEKLIKGDDPDRVNGVAYKKNEEIFLAPEREFPLNMDSFPELDYGLIPIDRYIHRRYPEWNSSQVRTLMVYGSIGCPYKCRFCINSIIHSSRYVYKSAERILNEIELLIKKYDLSHINFRDEDFFVSKERLRQLLNGIKARRLHFTWEANTRASYFNPNYLSAGILERMQECGCVRLGIGAESGSDRVLEMIKKDITIQHVINSARISHRSKIVIGYSFMIALPGESNDEMVATAQFIVRLTEENNRNYIVGPQIYRPYPGSELYQECLKYGMKEPEDLRGWKNQYSRSDIILDNKRGKLPWVQDIRFVKILHFYARCAALFVHKGGFLEKLTRRFISRISSLRIKHNFLRFPIEYYLYYLLTRIVSSINR